MYKLHVGQTLTSHLQELPGRQQRFAQLQPDLHRAAFC
jgi:hypothetical protein